MQSAVLSLLGGEEGKKENEKNKKHTKLGYLATRLKSIYLPLVNQHLR